jgi:hypothetical protein
MKYLCLVYHDEGMNVDALPRAEFNEIVSEVYECVDGFRASGNYVLASPLERSQGVATLRVNGGVTSVTDGPFIETKDQLAGFYILEARDLNDAIRLVSRTPSARFGSIEVRPLRELTPK